MPISTIDLKDFAAGLAVADSDETKLRASASRAYYACFHALLPLVSQMPTSERCPPNVTHVTHEEMSARIAEWKVEGIHSKLARMTSTKGAVRRALDASRALRVKADYRLGGEVTLGEAQSQVERARQVIRAVAQFDIAMTSNSDVA